MLDLTGFFSQRFHELCFEILTLVAAYVVDLAPRLLQRAPRRPRGAPYHPDRGAAQPQGQSREDRRDYVRDLRDASLVR